MAEFIVRRAAGMGVMHYFRVHARSARQIMETFADLQVVTEPPTLARADAWVECDIDIDGPVLPAEFEELRAERDAQRGRPRHRPPARARRRRRRHRGRVRGRLACGRATGPGPYAMMPGWTSRS